jgi:hypothetical protein
MGQNLTGQTIASTYEDLVQISGSILTNGLGNNITAITVTASNATSAVSASHAINANSAISASFATTASYALNVPIVNTGSLLVTASISDATITFTKGDASTFNITVNNVLNADSASVATSASFAQNANIANSATTATSASHAVNADNAITASYALNAGGTTNTGSFYVSSSVNNATITFTQGDGTTEAVTVNNVLNASTASAVNTTPADDNVEYAVTFVAQEAAGTQIVRTDDNSNITFNPTTGTLTVPLVNGTATNALTASLAQNIVPGLSPSFTNVTVTNDLVVNGTASIALINYVTGSATYIGDSFVVVNTDLPAQRYAGLAVFDSGSSPQVSASLEWDGGNDVWILKEETGNTAAILTGPTGSRGSEIFPTVNKLQKGLGWNYLGDSSITDNGTVVSIASRTEISGSAEVTAEFRASSSVYFPNLSTSTQDSIVTLEQSTGFLAKQVPNAISVGTASIATSASYALTASYLEGGAATFPYTGSAQITGSLAVTGSITRREGAFSGSVVDNITDVYTSTAAIEHVVSLTQAEYNTISGSADPNTLYYITDAPSFATSASFASTASYVLNAVSSSFATSASFSTTALTASFYSLAGVTQNAVFSGSVRGEVRALTVSSNTASMDLSIDNFFTLQLVSGSNVRVEPSNILPGQTINLRVNTTGSGTVSFPTTVKQVSGSAYVPTTTTGVDIVTFIAFDSSSLFLSNVKNLV